MNKLLIWTPLILATACGEGIPSQTFSTDPVGDISGRILDIASGAPLARAEVKLTDRFAISDNDGTYQLFDIPVGQHAITASLPGYTSYYATVTIANEATVFDIFLVPELGENCVDADGDGHGEGPDCLGSDCNDQDRSIQRGCTAQVCENVSCGANQRCLATAAGASCECVASHTRCGGACIPSGQTCNPGCQDADMDGYGVGADCAGWDCNDQDPSVTETCPSDGEGTLVGRIELDPAAMVTAVQIRVAGLTASPGPDSTFRIDAVPAGFVTVEIELDPYFPVILQNVPILADSTYDAGTINLSLDYYFCDQTIDPEEPSAFGDYVLSPSGRRLILGCDDGMWRAFDLGAAVSPLSLPSLGDRFLMLPSDDILVAWEFTGGFPSGINLRYYDLNAAQQLAELDLEGPVIFPPEHYARAGIQEVLLKHREGLFRLNLTAPTPNPSLDALIQGASGERPYVVGWQGDELLFGLTSNTQHEFTVGQSTNPISIRARDLRALSPAAGARFLFQSSPSAILTQTLGHPVGIYDGVMSVREVSGGVYQGDALYGYNAQTGAVDRLQDGDPGELRHLLYADAMRQIVIYAHTYDLVDPTSLLPQEVRAESLRWFNLQNGQSGVLVTSDGTKVVRCNDARVSEELLCELGPPTLSFGSTEIFRINLNTLVAESIASLSFLALGSSLYLGPEARTYLGVDQSVVNSGDTSWLTAFREVAGDFQSQDVLTSHGVQLMPNRRAVMFRQTNSIFFRRLVPGLNIP